MIRTIATLLIGTVIAAPAYAESHSAGDVAAGEKAFRKCATCHVVRDDEGQVLAGKKAKSGPNLFGIIGRQAGSIEGFRYGKSIIAAGEAGLIWDLEKFAIYAQDPKAFLQEFLDDKRARSKMSYKVRGEEDAVNLGAFLASLGPVAEVEDATEEDTDTNN